MFNFFAWALCVGIGTKSGLIQTNAKSIPKASIIPQAGEMKKIFSFIA